MLMNQHLRMGKVGQKAPDRVPVGADGGCSALLSQYFVEMKAIGFKEGPFQQIARDPQPDVIKIGQWRKVVFRKLIDIEGEFRPNVTVGAFIVGNGMPILQS